MINENNNPTRLRETESFRDLQAFFRNARPEDVKAHRDCLASAYYKGGLPCAILMESLYYFKLLEKPKTVRQRVFVFLGNLILGSFVFTPVCHSKFLQAQKEFLQQESRKESPIFPVTEDAQPVTRLDDFSYPADAMTNLSEPETDFSSDFISSTLVSDVSVEKDLKTPATTYEELRARNRKNFAYEPPVSSLTSEYSPGPSLNTPPVNKAPTDPSPPRRVVKNKYGDEIE